MVNRANDSIIYHDRVKAREYYEDHPDASYREVAEKVDASRPTVTEWLKEDFDEDDDERIYTNAGAFRASSRKTYDGARDQDQHAGAVDSSSCSAFHNTQSIKLDKNYAKVGN